MYRFFFKRVLDIIVSLIALPFVLVISLILSVVIFFNDGGTPFYFAERLGKKHKPRHGIAVSAVGHCRAGCRAGAGLFPARRLQHGRV